MWKLAVVELRPWTNSGLGPLFETVARTNAAGSNRAWLLLVGSLVVDRLPALRGAVQCSSYHLVVQGSGGILLGDRPRGRPQPVGRRIRRVTAETRRELLPIGQFNDDAFQAFVVELFASHVLHTDAPGDPFISHELTAKNSNRTAAPRPRHHVGGDKQRLAALRLCRCRHPESWKQSQETRSRDRHLSLFSSSRCYSTAECHSMREPN